MLRQRILNRYTQRRVLPLTLSLERGHVLLTKTTTRMEDDKRLFPEATIVDVRPQAAYLQRHIKGSVSFELATLGVGGGDDTRATELPSRSWPNVLKVMGSNPDETRLGLDWLETRGWKVNREDSRSETEVDWDELELNDLVERGASMCRFWRASPPLERRCGGVEALLRETFPERKERWVLDLGCGSGRDAVFLAMRGWHVLAVDREEPFLQKLESFAARQNVSHLITTRIADLRPQFLNKNLGEILTETRFDMIHMSRFMNRPLLNYLVHNLPKHSFLAIHHFLVGAQSRHGKPFRQGAEQTLRPGELASEWFTLPRFQVLMDEESALADGRPVVNFICRRQLG